MSDLSAEIADLKRQLTKAEEAHAELWAERNGWQARAEIAERQLAEVQRTPDGEDGVSFVSTKGV